MDPPVGTPVLARAAAGGATMRSRARDESLLARAKRGDPEAFIELTEPWRGQLYSVVCRMVGPQDADDVVQEAFIRAFRSIGRFRGEASLSTWLTRIAINVAIRHASRVRRTASLDGTSTESAGEDLPDLATALAVREAVAGLSPKLRAAVVLFYLEGLELNEVASVLRIRRGTVASRLHEARRLLRERLGPVLEAEKGAAP